MRKLHRKREPMQRFAGIFLTAVTVLCLFPFLLMITASFTDNTTIAQYGYSLFPKALSLDAYQYLLRQSKPIINGFSISVLITAVGVAVGVACTMLIAYPLSRRDFPWRKQLMIFVLIPLLFYGGIVPQYLIYTQVFHFKNTLLGLLIPNLLVNSFHIILFRTYFTSSIPDEIIEAAYVDGAGEMTIFLRIIIALSKPIIATLAIFTGIAYWNDWVNSLYYITDSNLYSLQGMLVRILSDIQFMNSSAATNVSIAAQTKAVTLPTGSMRMAIAVVGMLPALIVFPFVNRAFTSGIVLGAVKG